MLSIASRRPNVARHNAAITTLVRLGRRTRPHSAEAWPHMAALCDPRRDGASERPHSTYGPPRVAALQLRRTILLLQRVHLAQKIRHPELDVVADRAHLFDRLSRRIVEFPVDVALS